MPTEVASVSVQRFKKDFPSRFLTLQYKVSELDYAQSSSTLIRLLHIEALEGWRSQKKIAEILPQLSQRIPSFVGGSQGSSSRKLNKSILEVIENIEDPADRKRRLLFSMACQSMNNVQTKRGSDEEATFLSEEDALWLLPRIVYCLADATSFVVRIGRHLYVHHRHRGPPKHHINIPGQRQCQQSPGGFNSTHKAEHGCLKKAVPGP